MGAERGVEGEGVAMGEAAGAASIVLDSRLSSARGERCLLDCADASVC